VSQVSLILVISFDSKYIRMERVSYAYNFAAFDFYVCVSDISDSASKPRAIAINRDKPGGLAQLAELNSTNDFREIGLAWIDTELPVSHILDIRPNPSAETKSQIEVQILKSVSEASNAFDEIIRLLKVFIMKAVISSESYVYHHLFVIIGRGYCPCFRSSRVFESQT